MDCSPPGSSVPGNSPGKSTGVGCRALLQGIFPTQRLIPGLPHCRQILYHLSHQGNPRILEWVACPFSRGSSQPRNQNGISCIAGRFFIGWVTREAPLMSSVQFSPSVVSNSLRPHESQHANVLTPGNFSSRRLPIIVNTQLWFLLPITPKCCCCC